MELGNEVKKKYMGAMFSESDRSLNQKSCQFTVHWSNRDRIDVVINLYFIILYIINLKKLKK